MLDRIIHCMNEMFSIDLEYFFTKIHITLLNINLSLDRLSLFKAEDKCFVTFDSDPLVIPTIGSYNVYYAPNTSQSGKI